jgi:hypothetical protein
MRSIKIQFIDYNSKVICYYISYSMKASNENNASSILKYLMLRKEFAQVIVRQT